ncbi:uracil-DNA glycosylase family protein [Massilia forsythiae]|nr:uracil-DNA glycosylase family protein [Massilia forsythiae]
MNGFVERDAIFLAEMGLGPLWRLRAAPAAAAGAQAGDAGGDDVAVSEAAFAVAPAPSQGAAHPPSGAGAEARAAAQPAPPAPQQAADAVRPPPVSPPVLQQAAPQGRTQQEPPAAPRPAAAQTAQPLPPAPTGPRPLQPVAQAVSALAPEASAWDDGPAAPDATPEQIAAMDWDQLNLAIATCRRCSACRDGRAPVPGTGARTARWLVAAGASTAADEKARLPLAGDPGKLLDNMLAAVGMGRERDVYVTNLIKCRPLTAAGAERAPSATEAAACRLYLEREAALTGAATVLTLGQIAANTLLGRPLAEPLAGARGAVHAVPLNAAELALVATLHPGELLRRGADKAQAWADLCRARAAQPGQADGG